MSAGTHTDCHTNIQILNIQQEVRKIFIRCHWCLLPEIIIVIIYNGPWHKCSFHIKRQLNIRLCILENSTIRTWLSEMNWNNSWKRTISPHSVLHHQPSLTNNRLLHQTICIELSKTSTMEKQQPTSRTHSLAPDKGHIPKENTTSTRKLTQKQTPKQHKNPNRCTQKCRHQHIPWTFFLKSCFCCSTAEATGKDANFPAATAAFSRQISCVLIWHSNTTNEHCQTRTRRTRTISNRPKRSWKSSKS